MSRNFQNKWLGCRQGRNLHHKDYPGVRPFSEKETQFVRYILAKYNGQTSVYVTVRRNGHSLLYPYAASKKRLCNTKKKIMHLASGITNKVNQRPDVIQFSSMTPFMQYVRTYLRCGHSVDYAYDHGIRYAFEMHVFLGVEFEVMSLFKALPKTYFNSLFIGYISGIRTLYELLVAES